MCRAQVKFSKKLGLFFVLLSAPLLYDSAILALVNVIYRALISFLILLDERQQNLIFLIYLKLCVLLLNTDFIQLSTESLFLFFLTRLCVEELYITV